MKYSNFSLEKLIGLRDKLHQNVLVMIAANSPQHLIDNIKKELDIIHYQIDIKWQKTPKEIEDSWYEKKQPNDKKAG